MNDLELVARFGAELDPPDGAPPAGLRARVVSRLAAEPAEPVRPDRDRPGRTPVRRRRWAWRLALAGGLAAALAAGIVVAGDWAPGRGPERHGALPGRTASTPRDAAAVLRLAASAAQAAPFTPPRPDQYLFVEMRTPRLVQNWYSVDGYHDSMVRMEGVGEWHRPPPSCLPPRCMPLPAYVPELPTDADAMLTWLRDMDRLAKIPVGDDFVIMHAVTLLLTNYLPPDVTAAIFHAVAKVPGIVLVPDATDRIGRHGVKVTRPVPSQIRDPSYKGPPLNESLIFDASTYAFLGTEHAALTREAIVDHVGQVP